MSESVASILAAGAQEVRGEGARMQCFIGALALGDMIKTSLGPRGRDKILQQVVATPGTPLQTSVTNDGATILKKVWVDNSAAQILVDLSLRQDEKVGDGTTGVVILAAEIIRAVEPLFKKNFHPQTVIEGLHIARSVALSALEKKVIALDMDSDSTRNYLLKLAKTTLSSKILVNTSDHFSKLAVDSVLRLKNKNHLKLVKIIKKLGSSAENSVLLPDIVLERELPLFAPKKYENVKVLICNTKLDTDRVKIFGAKVEATSYNEVVDIQEAERQKMLEKVEKIAAFGCDILVSRQLVYDYPMQLLRDKNITVISNADFEGVELLADSLGAEIVSTFDNPDPAVLGHCSVVEEILLAGSKMIRFSGQNESGSSTIILRGASEHMLDETERSLHDAICVVSQTLQNPKLILGGGNAEAAMSVAVQEHARTLEGKLRLVLEAYAQALLEIPIILCSNGGLDGPDLASVLAAKLAKDPNSTLGVEVCAGKIGCMDECGIYECYKSKRSQVYSATEAAEQIIRIDNIIKCAPKQRKSN